MILPLAVIRRLDCAPAKAIVLEACEHHGKSRYDVRLGNGTREITDEGEQQRFIAGRWGKGP